MAMIQGQLQFEHVALLSTTYQEFVHWLQVSTKACDGRLTFVWATFIWHTVCNANASHMLVHLYTHWLIFAFTELKLTIHEYYHRY